MLVNKQLWLPLTSIVWTINTETVIKIPLLFFSQGKSYRFGTASGCIMMTDFSFPQNYTNWSNSESFQRNYYF